MILVEREEQEEALQGSGLDGATYFGFEQRMEEGRTGSGVRWGRRWTR